MRKVFKTRMENAHVPSDHSEYMMGHIVSTYDDVASLGIERLRAVYASANLTMRPTPKVSKLEMVKEFARGLGLDPEQIQLRQAMLQPDAKFLDPTVHEQHQMRAMVEAIRRELTRPPTFSKSPGSSSGVAGPEGFEPSTFGFPLGLA